MGPGNFDRVAIALTEGGQEYIVLETQLTADFGSGQGPKAGVITVQDGWLAVFGAGVARLETGEQAPGGAFPPRLTLANLQDKLMVEIAAHEGPVSNDSNAVVYLSGGPATLRMRDDDGNDHVLLEGSAGRLWLGGQGADGDVLLFRHDEQNNGNAGKASIRLLGASAAISAGGHSTDGALGLLNHDNEPCIHFDAGGAEPSPQTRVYVDGVHGNIVVGGHDQDGDLLLLNARNEVSIHLDAGGGAPTPPTTTVYIDGVNSNIALGGNDTVGDLMLRDELGKTRIHLRASGGPMSGDTRVYVDGQKGDIVLANADCAEEFDIADAAEVERGTVMVIDVDGKLRTSAGAYDTKVAGVISGDGDSGPGIVLGREKESQDRRVAVALAGRVSCKVDAQYGPISAGDLLVTSPTPGHAMRGADPQRAFGAVVGKALQSLRVGQGILPILVALQ